MKPKLILCSFMLISHLSLLISQIPQGFNYQAIARDEEGNPITTTLQVKVGFQKDTLLSSFIWEELHPAVNPNSQGLFSLSIGTGSRISGAEKFSDIDWTKTPIYMKTFISTGSQFNYMGAARLWSVPYSLIAGELGGAVSKLEVLGEDISSDEALFEVKRKDGKTMFAVYNHGVRVYMPLDTLSKGRKGGFAIGGFSTAKEDVIQDYFVVNPDSIRAYIDSNPGKARKGGFAIGSFNKSKADSIQEYLTVSSDSVRIYIDDNLLKAGRKGGFAIGSFDAAKAGKSTFFDVSPNTGDIIASQNRILWYPKKNAFLTGKVKIEKPDSVGENSFSSGYESKAKGNWSQALGYKAIARGNYSTAIGKNAVANSLNSFAFGDGAKARKNDSYSFGAGAIANGTGSYAFGSAGRDTLGNLTGYMTTASGNYSFATGQGARATNNSAFAMGSNVLASGNSSTALGTNSIASGPYSISMGVSATASGSYSTAMGLSTTANGYNSTAIGYGTIASGSHSTAIGSNTTAPSCFEVAVGSNNLSYTPVSATTWNSADRIFVIGNGYFTLNPSTQQLVSHPSNAITVLKNGKTGIGTDAPLFLLDIKSGSLGYTINSNVQWQRLYGASSNQDQLKIIHRRFITGTDWASSEIRIQKTVDVTDMGYIAFKSHYLEFGGGYGGNPYMTLINGKLGIGTTEPDYELKVMGYAWCSGTWSTSDIRWKKDIIDMNGILDKVLKLHPVKYNLRTDEFPEMKFESGDQVGLIAQDVEKVLPVLVKTDKNGYKAVAYDKLSAILVEAIKEQQIQIGFQQQQIESEKQKNLSLESELESLKERMAEIEAIVGNR